MFFYMSYVAFLLTICHWSSAQVPFPNHCPDVKVLEDFQLDDYMGIWYEYSKYPFVFEIGKKCMYAKYENIGNGMISVMNAAINRLTEQRSNVTGRAKVIGSGQLAVVFPRSRNQNFDKPNYLVLGTDYSEYAVVYSCTNMTSFAHTEIVWILTRAREPSADTITAARKVMDDNNLSQSFLINTIQDECPDLNAIVQNSQNSDEILFMAEAGPSTTNFEDVTTSNIIEKA